MAKKFGGKLRQVVVEEAIFKPRPGEACRVDAFPNEFLIHGGPVLIEAITKMFVTIQGRVDSRRLEG